MLLIVLLLGVPFVLALAALCLPRTAAMVWPRRLLLPAGAAAHAALTALLWFAGLKTDWLPGFGPDPTGILFLSLTSGLFFLAALYSLGDLKRYEARSEAAGGSEAVYVGCLFFFLFAMTAVCLADDMGLLWVAVEATTLATAPLIYFRKNQGSLEATWKYLLLCSVGIALALLGTFIMAAAAGQAARGDVTLRIAGLSVIAKEMDPALLRAAFIFLLVGYGAKMGLAPLHNWLPDAHSEAPSPVSALLSGTLLNGAFLAILRSLEIMRAANLGDFSEGLLRLFGLFSMALAGAFILGQRDFKRLLAYSSVEHMGILAFGAGMAGPGIWAALLHAVNHTFAKGCLFLVAGNIMFRYHSKSTLTVRGLRRSMPLNAALWLGGFLAICGLPPFGMFFSEFSLVAIAFSGERYLEGALFLAFLAVVFVGILGAVLGMLRGEAQPLEDGAAKESVWMFLPPLAALAVPLVLGMGVPGFLGAAIGYAAWTIDHTFTSMPGILSGMLP